MKVKYFAQILILAGLAMGTTMESGIPNGQRDDGLDKAAPENNNIPTTTCKHSHSNCSTYEPVKHSSELQDYHFRGLKGPEAFDEYLAMVEELLDTESHYLKSRYAFAQPLKRYLCLPFSQLFLIGSVSVTLLFGLLPLRKS